ncbi:radiation insensitive 1 isoform X6 [Leptinotarsa decemlineata]|uniref:radiation insensitive 1 isoform X6 n=1 Tax=Leptinotarsa decemlineata TaxID=7539 RepID=UPI003D30AEE5
MLFCAEITDIRIIYNVLRSITIKDYVILRPLAEGLKLTLDEMKCVETSTYIPCDMFSFYHVDSTEDIIFKINFKTLVDILNIFGDDGNPNVKLSYKSVGSPLCIVMNHNEENITVDCEIKTMNIDDINDGESEVHISKNSDSVTVYQCTQTTTSVYSFSYIRQILKVI